MEVEAGLSFIEPNPNGPAMDGACIDLCGGTGTDVDDDVGAASLVDFWISDKKSSLEMVAVQFSDFLWGGIWTPLNFMCCFPFSLNTLSAWKVANVCARYGWNSGLAVICVVSISILVSVITNVEGLILSMMCVSGNTVDKIHVPAMICGEVSLVKVLVDMANKVDS